MHVSVYTRHSQDCPKKDNTAWKQCRCPKWLYYFESGHRYQFSVKTRIWGEAERKARKDGEGTG